ncbi:hypothetical protein V5O48_000838 [Marasmius crinis-equi]|uniref:H15 domain-containing protein n=1 Tax=Marasmius crinis-equi TaxID=585013 RepID=A0ABR3G0F1_9AGAR
MIVEVLSTVPDDSEGLFPKDLWSWMASRYPLQSNFRPSAGQALGKAYKKGRLEKSDSGRYRLNPDWKGGSTTRKGTRRPQLQASSGAPSSSQSRPPPFTNAPLIRGTPAPPFTAPSGQPMLGYNFHPPTAHKTITNGNAGTASNSAAAEENSGDIGDAFEAAQHILKAINFTGLLSMDDEEAKDSEPPTNAGGNADASGSGSGFDESVRAELQAQLALLAVQLGEILQEPEPEPEPEDMEMQAETPVDLTPAPSRPQIETQGRESRPEAEPEGQTETHEEIDTSSLVRDPPQPLPPPPPPQEESGEVETLPDMALCMEDSDSDADMDEVIV